MPFNRSKSKMAAAEKKQYEELKKLSTPGHETQSDFNGKVRNKKQRRRTNYNCCRLV